MNTKENKKENNFKKAFYKMFVLFLQSLLSVVLKH